MWAKFYDKIKLDTYSSQIQSNTTNDQKIVTMNLIDKLGWMWIRKRFNFNQVVKIFCMWEDNKKIMGHDLS